MVELYLCEVGKVLNGEGALAAVVRLLGIELVVENEFAVEAVAFVVLVATWAHSQLVPCWHLKVFLLVEVALVVGSSRVTGCQRKPACDAPVVVLDVLLQLEVGDAQKDMHFEASDLVVDVDGVEPIVVDVVAGQNKPVVIRLEWPELVHTADVTDHGRPQPLVASTAKFRRSKDVLISGSCSHCMMPVRRSPWTVRE